MGKRGSNVQGKQVICINPDSVTVEGQSYSHVLMVFFLVTTSYNDDQKDIIEALTPLLHPNSSSADAFKKKLKQKDWKIGNFTKASQGDVRGICSQKLLMR